MPQGRSGVASPSRQHTLDLRKDVPNALVIWHTVWEARQSRPSTTENADCYSFNRLLFPAASAQEANTRNHSTKRTRAEAGAKPVPLNKEPRSEALLGKHKCTKKRHPDQRRKKGKYKVAYLCQFLNGFVQGSGALQAKPNPRNKTFCEVIRGEGHTQKFTNALGEAGRDHQGFDSDCSLIFYFLFYFILCCQVARWLSGWLLPLSGWYNRGVL